MVEAILQPLNSPQSVGGKVERKGYLVQNFARGWGYFMGLIPAFPGHQTLLVS